MMQYDGDLAIPQHFLVPPPQIEDPLSHYLCGTGIRSFAISETQKYGHVTYFWNGNNSGYVDPACERYIEILGDPRPFEAQPAMQSVAITDAAIDCIRSGDYAFGRINFPNGDMIGHTGNLAAAIASVEAVDACVNRLVDAMRALGGITVILADHGNADAMGQRDATGRVTPITAHTCNPVPCCIVGAPEFAWVTVEQPGLSHIASTLCVLMGYEAPAGFNPALVTRR
jgi:2,3-bisphosphoglycerate-independent phosphoglycerate mutase